MTQTELRKYLKKNVIKLLKKKAKNIFFSKIRQNSKVSLLN